MSRLDYLLSILVFAGLANVVIWTRLMKRSRHYWRSGLVFSLVLVPVLGIAEGPALNWGAWAYNPARTFNIKIFGTEAETFIFVLFVSAAIFGATILFTAHEDRHRPPKSKLRKS